MKILMICFWGICALEACRNTAIATDTVTRPPALVMAHDISITCLQQPAPTREQLRERAQFIARAGGCIGFALVGSPDSVGDLIRQAFLQPPRQPLHPTYLAQRRFRQAMDSVERINNQRVSAFVDSALVLISRYPPQQHTDLNGRHRLIRIFFGEPGMDEYAPFYYLESDGRQDVRMRHSPVDTVLRLDILPAELTVLTCGWKNPLYPPTWTPLASPAALIPALQSLTLK